MRPLLSNAKPLYAGVSFIEIGIPDVERTPPDLARLVGKESLMAFPMTKAFLRSEMVMDVSCLRGPPMPENWLATCGIPFDRSAEARRALLDFFADWSNELKELVRACADCFLPAPDQYVANRIKLAKPA